MLEDWLPCSLEFSRLQVKSVPVAEGLVEDHFDVTVKMSTYLVAFIVSDFESVSKVTKSGVKVSL